MTQFRNIADIRRDYGELSLDEAHVSNDPLEQFTIWFEEVLNNEKNDPTAMVLSTVDKHGHPDSRVVLLKGLDQGNFIFYTNYQSAKASQIQHNSFVALNFYWPQMARQVRIRGSISKVSAQQSDEYFLSRPLKSQLSAFISPQSEKIVDRTFLENELNKLANNNADAAIQRPKHWGGYQVSPSEIEFWQGRDNRLHDRILFSLENNIWQRYRLAP